MFNLHVAQREPRLAVPAKLNSKRTEQVVFLCPLPGIADLQYAQVLESAGRYAGVTGFPWSDAAELGFFLRPPELVGMKKSKETAPTETVGSILSLGQDAEKGIRMTVVFLLSGGLIECRSLG